VAVSATLTPAIGASSAPFIGLVAVQAVDEIYAQMKKKIAGGKTEQQAIQEVAKEFKEEPPSTMLYVVGGVALLGLLFLMKKKRG
jgi:hypothetical protein